MSPDENKTREPLGRLATLHQQVAEFEVLESGLEWAEETLRESGEKYRLLFDGASNPITVYASDGTLLLMNIAAAKDLGGAPDDFVGKSICEVHPSIADIAMDRIRQVVELGESREFETVMKLPSGWRWYWSNFQPVRDASGNVKAVQIISYDITERKLAEEEIQQQNEFLNNILESLVHPFYVIDVNDYTVKLANPAAKLGNLSENPTCHALIHKSSKPCEGTGHPCPLREVKKTKKSVVVEHIHYDRDGNARNVEVHCYPVLDTEGSVIQMIEYCLDITERKQAQETLRESEERHRAIVEQAPESIVLVDAETGVLVDFNDRAHENLDYSREEFGKLKIPDFEVIESVEEVAKHIEKIVKEGADSFETKHRTKGGEIRDIQVSSRAICIGGMNFVQSMWRDITERKRMEEALSESEKRFRDLANFLPLTVFEMDDKGNFTFMNRQGFETFSYTMQEAAKVLNNPEALTLEEQDRLQGFIPEDRERIGKNRQRVLDGEDMGPVEYTAVRRDGSTFPVEVFYAPIIHAGKRTGLRGILIDITERKRAEEALRESEERYGALLNLGAEVGEAIVMLQDTEQGDAIQTFVSGDWPRITGYSEKELLGMSFFDLLHPRDREASLKRHKRKMSGATMPGLFEVTVIRKDGTEVPVELTSAYTTYQGERANVAFIRDISERKQAEERQKRLQEELNLSSRLASIGELAAGVAHEINNPLTGILGFSQRLMKKSTDEETSRDLERIHNEARRAAKVVDNLLTFARRREPKKQYLDINEILARTVELRAYELKTGNIELMVELAPSLPEIMVDFQQIQQVFLNIILNAEQAMTEANNVGKLSIKTQQAKGYIRVSFADDGPGIEIEHLDKLFGLFFTTRGEKGGTGLGLSVCQGIVTEHGGRIYARSKPGKGATFFVELPLTTAQIDEGKVTEEEPVRRG